MHKARSPQRAAQRLKGLHRAHEWMRGVTNIDAADPKFQELIELVVEYGGPDDSKDLGALKIFKIPPSDPQRQKAEMRLAGEVEALKALNELHHPGILRLLHANVEGHFIVTEYHPRGALNVHLDKYKGKPLEALEAFLPLARAVAEIHKSGKIHRDIKPENIFVTVKDTLALGDFGIVFFTDAQRSRLTEIYGERVGSHYWMPPWSYEPSRLEIDEIKPSLDIFPLAKVLWSMISGRGGLPFWEYDRPENNLETQFKDDVSMAYVNRILERCIVREEPDCLQSADALASLVEGTITSLKQMGLKIQGQGEWLCLVCKKGYYGKQNWQWRLDQVASPNGRPDPQHTSVYFCDHCGHMQVFRQS